MRQFEISETAESELLSIIKWYGRKKAERIEDAYRSLRLDLRDFPELGPMERDGTTRVLHRAGMYWVYEILSDRVRLLSVLDPRQDLKR